MNAPLVSIVLPTRNGMTTLPAVLQAIDQQRVDFPFELIAVDSSSTDGTPDLLRPRADRMISIAAEAFDHGLTRNTGVAAARGDLVVLMVQDALPASDSWLAALVAPLLANPRLAGTFARQVPHPEAGALTRHYLANWVASSELDRTVGLENEAEFGSLEPAARLERCAFDNVCACVRRAVWADHPFRPVAIGEDLAWAKDVLLAGYQLAYVPASVVVHSHDRTARYEFTRTYLLHRELYTLFRLRTIPTLPVLGRAVASSIRLHMRLERNARALALAVAWPLGQYLGGLSAVRGWTPSRSRTV